MIRKNIKLVVNTCGKSLTKVSVIQLYLSHLYTLCKYIYIYIENNVYGIYSANIEVYFHWNPSKWTYFQMYFDKDSLLSVCSFTRISMTGVNGLCWRSFLWVKSVGTYYKRAGHPDHVSWYGSVYFCSGSV